MSELLGNGCLTASARILRADNGAEVALADLMGTGERPLVWSLDERKRLVPCPMTDLISGGRAEAFTLRLASGREVEATADGRFMTLDGWSKLGALEVGDRLAVPRRVPEPAQTWRMLEADHPS